jgi:hypothetical protein
VPLPVPMRGLLKLLAAEGPGFHKMNQNVQDIKIDICNTIKKIIVKKCIRGFLHGTLNSFTHAFLYGISNKVAACWSPDLSRGNTGGALLNSSLHTFLYGALN